MIQIRKSRRHFSKEHPQIDDQYQQLIIDLYNKNLEETDTLPDVAHVVHDIIPYCMLLEDGAIDEFIDSLSDPLNPPSLMSVAMNEKAVFLIFQDVVLTLNDAAFSYDFGGEEEINKMPYKRCW